MLINEVICDPCCVITMCAFVMPISMLIHIEHSQLSMAVWAHSIVEHLLFSKQLKNNIKKKNKNYNAKQNKIYLI